MMENIKNPLVSIIVPVYNGENFLKCCIDSILSQSYKNFELILINDGSTDNSSKICEEYRLKDKRIKYLSQHNQGVSIARNKGLQIMQGEYVIFVDADDIVHKNLIDICIKTIKNSNCDLVIYSYKKFVNMIDYLLEKEIYEMISLTQKDIFREIFIGSNGRQRFRMLAWNKLYKAELFDDIKFPLNRKYGEDASVTYKIIKKVASAIFIDNPPLYFYRDNPNSALNKFLNEDNLQIFDTYNEIYLDIKNTNQKFLEYITAAYIIRIFEFICRIKNEILIKNNQLKYLKKLRIKIELKMNDVLKCKYVTKRLKILFFIYNMNIKLFFYLYFKKNRR